jgi:hypothetical protein
MVRKSHMINRGDGVIVNLNAPLRFRDKQMSKTTKKKTSLFGSNTGLKL